MQWTWQGAIAPGDGSVDTMPSVYSAGSEEIFTWMRGIAATPNIMEIALSQVAGWPGTATNVTTANAVPGWSPRVTRTLKPDTFMRVWVGASDLRLYYQVVAR
jgi:hypothetical protein